MTMTTHEDQGSLRDYLQIIFHRRWFFMMPFVIVFFTASIGSFFLPKYYQSAVLVLVEEEKPINPLATKEPTYVSVTGQPPTLSEQLKTLTEKLLSYPHLLVLVKTLGLDKGIADQASYEKLLMGIRKRAEVKMRSPDVFQISYEDKNPVVSRDSVRTLVKIFIDENKSKKTEQAKDAVKFAEQHAQLYKKKLEDSEKALFEFRAQYPMQLPGKELDYNVSMLTNYQTSLTAIQMSIKEAQNKIDLVKRQLAGREPVIITAESIDLNPAVSRLNSKLQSLQSQQEELIKTTPDSPDISSLQVEMEETRDQLRLETEKLVGGETAQTAPLFYKRLEQRLRDAQKEADELRVREKNLQGLVSEYEKRIETLPEQDRKLALLTRDTEVNDNIYKMLVLKVEENKLATSEAEEKGTKYTILDDARLPLKPSKPQILLIGIVAFILGILSGFGCVFMAEFADHSFRGVEDARAFLKFEILGGVAAIVDRNEVMARNARQRVVGVTVVILYIVFFAVAATYSNMRQEEVKNKVIEIANKEKTAEAKQYGK
ncbi:MAG: GNVR domain-containing protein [Candidatus Omnitrophica bacterium]|nr:GNVR domain-containing protein [Candidatus Omnitrophota bacterium]MDD5310169.1 GNVR domain-containing protein [Candidatus Omnitrophota bacterium]MDD5546254.1 GNVR domain-containing protein [Candidatus Omnitrophota bacterium]